MPYIPEIKIGNTTYKVKDQESWDHQIEASDTQPVHPANKIWVNEAASEEYEVPTMDDFNFLKSSLSYKTEGYNICKRRVEYTHNGVAYYWDSNLGMYHVSGTVSSSSTSLYNIFYDGTNAIPEGIVPGKSYRLTIKAKDIPDDVVRIQFYGYVRSESSIIASCVYSKNTKSENYKINIPNNINGLLIRIQVPAGSPAVNGYIGVELCELEDLTNYQIENMLRDNTMGVFSVQSLTNPAKTDFHVYASCDDVDRSCIMFVTFDNGIPSISDFPLSAAGWLVTIAVPSLQAHRLQYAVSYKGLEATMSRFKGSGVWYNWVQENQNRRVLSEGTALSSLRDAGNYILDGGKEYEGMPYESGAGFLMVIPFSNNWWVHVLIRLSNVEAYVQILNRTQVSKPWSQIGGGGGNVYNITQNINRDEISNAYSGSVSPSITTDSNGWLQPTGDTTDMTSSIMAMLNGTGYCHLAPGRFYVSGNIDLPDGATLEGCGKCTILQLLDNVQSGYIARVGLRNTIKNLSLKGQSTTPSDLYTDGTNLGSKHGIVYLGNDDGQEPSHDRTNAYNIIENCYMEYFDGSAFYGRNVGGSTASGVKIHACNIRNCRVGINIDYRVEYSVFENCQITNCYYACINNGGNNVFSACEFHGVVGWLLDNSNNDKENNSHGTCIGCVFNHIDNMNHPETLGGGLAIHTINASHGFVFTGCQLWYGNVLIENSQGITISNSMLGNSHVEITVTGSYPAFFFGNIFKAAPTVLDVNSSTKFANNYTMAGVAVNAN